MTSPFPQPRVGNDAPQSGQDLHRQRRRSWLLWLILGGVAPILLLCSGVLAIGIWFQIQRSTAVRAVQAEVDRIHAVGEPITSDDLHAYHRVPDGVVDSTALWLTALRSFNEEKFNADYQAIAWFDSRGEVPLTDAERESAQAFLTQYQATIDATLAAARAGGECRLPVKFEDGIAALLPDAQRIRTLVRIQALRARHAADLGDTEQAVVSIEAIFAASRAMGHQLTLVEHLIHVATSGVGYAELEYLLNRQQLTDEQLARLQTAVARLDPHSGLADSMLGERGMGYHTFHHLDVNQLAGGNVPAPPPAPGEGTLWRPADCQFYLEMMAEAIDASRAPFPESLDRVNRIDAKLKSVMANANPLEKMNMMTTSLIMPAMSAAFSASARAEAQRNLSLLMIAARRHQLAAGKLPSRQDELVPQVLPATLFDPYDGLPLRIVADPDGLRLYSSGRDRVDDKGSDAQTPRLEPDLVARLRNQPGPQEADGPSTDDAMPPDTSTESDVKVPPEVLDPTR
jgi:hypothetical protein